MNKIVLTFESKLPTINFKVKLNNDDVDYIIDKNLIEINVSLSLGIHLLSLELSDDNIELTKLALVGASVNGVDLRHTIYLAYSEDNGVKFCNTWITQSIKNLFLPFGNPVSHWLSECSEKISNTIYGTNLYETYEIYYPQTKKISKKFPKLMQDFMQYDFGFTVVNKCDPIKGNKKIPWVSIKFDYNEAALLNEFNSNIELIKSNYYEPKQNQYNNKESPGKPTWRVALAAHRDTRRNTEYATNNGLIEEFDRLKLPLFYNILDDICSMDIKIIHAFIGVVEPNSYVAPHCDDFYKNDSLYKETEGVSQFFIPIGWQQGNYFKFNNAGFIPWEKGAYLVNNSDFMHGSVNNSPTVRYTIGVYCNFTEENIRKLTQKNTSCTL